MATKLWFRKVGKEYLVYTEKPVNVTKFRPWAMKEIPMWEPEYSIELCARELLSLFPHLREAKIGKEPVAVSVTIKVGGK